MVGHVHSGRRQSTFHTNDNIGAIKYLILSQKNAPATHWNVRQIVTGENLTLKCVRTTVLVSSGNVLETYVFKFNVLNFYISETRQYVLLKLVKFTWNK